MQSRTVTASRGIQGTLATNKLIRNTYTLLAMTLIFSAATAGLSVYLNLPRLGLIVTIVIRRP